MRIHSSGSPPDGEDGDEPQDEPDDDPADSGRDDHVGLGHHVVDEGLAGVPGPRHSGQPTELQHHNNTAE